jgi:hypothetical protein
MMVAKDNYVADDDGRRIAGPFESNAAAWRWIDRHTNEGLEDQHRFNQIGRAYDGLTLEGLSEL